MNPKEFERAVASASHFRPTELDQRTRDLREAGLLVAGPRGPHALDIEPAAAALIVCSLAAPIANECARFVGDRMGLVGRKGRGTFGEALVATLTAANWNNRGFVREVRVIKTFPAAIVVGPDKTEVAYGGFDHDLQDGWGNAFDETVFRAGFLHTLALGLMMEKPDEFFEAARHISRLEWL